MTAAITIGNSSFIVICLDVDDLSHCSWNHSDPDQASHPHKPEASEVSTAWGVAWGKNSSIPVLAKNFPPHQVFKLMVEPNVMVGSFCNAEQRDGML